MELLIFDMDGVLLQPRGYHLALQETVRLAGEWLGLGDVRLTDEQIASFEALGISSEWHSSALAMGVLTLHQGAAVRASGEIILDVLFDKIGKQPLEIPALERSISALRLLAEDTGLLSEEAIRWVTISESIAVSPTINWFQELILGSELFARTYQKPAKFSIESYLSQYDRPILSSQSVEKLLAWSAKPERGAAVMTNRPSSGPDGFEGSPDADMGLELVGLNGIPVIGYSEIEWIAEQTGLGAGTLNKPHWAHALSAILTAYGWGYEKSLNEIVGVIEDDRRVKESLSFLNGGRIRVFEDTPAGLAALDHTADVLKKNGVQVTVEKIGIATDPVKSQALADRGAQVFPDVNTALAGFMS